MLTWMLLLEGGKIIRVLVHNDPQIIGLLVRRHIVLGETLRHCCG